MRLALDNSFFGISLGHQHLADRKREIRWGDEVALEEAAVARRQCDRKPRLIRATAVV